MAAVIIRSGKLVLLKAPTKFLIPQVIGNDDNVLVLQLLLACTGSCRRERANLSFLNLALVACDLVLEILFSL